MIENVSFRDTRLGCWEIQADGQAVGQLICDRTGWFYKLDGDEIYTPLIVTSDSKAAFDFAAREVQARFANIEDAIESGDEFRDER